MPPYTIAMRLLPLLFLLPLSLATAAPERLPLWPQGAPNAKGQTDDDQPRLARADVAAVDPNFKNGLNPLDAQPRPAAPKPAAK